MEMYELLKTYLPDDIIDKLKYEMEKDKPNKGLILNTLRTDESILKEFKSITKDDVDSSLFLYSGEEDRPGKNILHECGAYYILDPSANIIAENLISTKAEVVLDMCAAPGGKTISFALKNPSSLIIANDFSQKRAAELAKNVERMGLANVIVTSYEPKYFIDNFSNYFDKIILDTPCSGTGMFRKELEVKEDWSIEKVNRLLPLQDELLEIAYTLLKDNGVISYSTCSFLKEEDEDRIEHLLSLHANLIPLAIKHQDGFYYGTIKESVHLFPSLYKKGEGHFICFIKKISSSLNDDNYMKSEGVYDKTLNLYKVQYKGDTYALPFIDRKFMKLDSLRFGLKLTNNAKYSKMTLDHALSHYLDSTSSIDISKEDAFKYIRGEEIDISSNQKDGIVILSYQHINLGYGKKVKNKIKNYYPKGLRKQL